MIPKIIHFCWFGKKSKPELVTRCIATWKKHLPGWRIIEWTEENSPIDIPYVSNALKQKRYAFAADYVRFHALYEIGGVYLDTDMEIIRDISPLLTSEFFIGKESAHYISAGIIGAQKGHNITWDIINTLKNKKGNNYESIPKILTKIISDIELKPIHDIIYPPEYFYPFNPFDEKRNQVKQLMFCDITENTYAIHHWQQSWSFTLTERIKNRLQMIIGNNNEL